MNEIELRPGETLRIENPDGRVLTLFAPPGSELWELRVGARRSALLRVVGEWWARSVRAWREGRDARLLAQYDVRLLNDIGLGPDAGNSLATRIHNYQQEELRRSIMALRGLL